MRIDEKVFNEPEPGDEIRRPFVVKVDESVARAFIRATQRRGWYVRETIVKLMREFAKEFGDK